jgi:hypothetical protein
MECVEKIIKKDWSHPLTGAKLKERDIIPLQRVITVALSYDDLTFLMMMSMICFGKAEMLLNNMGHIVIHSVCIYSIV